jgi:AraC-like DNA-binding protein
MMNRDENALTAAIGRLPKMRGAHGVLAPRELPTPKTIECFRRLRPQDAMDGGPHLHARFVLCLCVTGGGSIVVGQGLVTLKPGECLLIFPYESHHFHRFESEAIVWAFTGFELDDEQPVEVLRGRAFPCDAGLREDFRRVFESAVNGTGGGWRCSAELLALLGTLVNLAAASRDTTDRTGHPLVRAVLKELRKGGMPDGIAGIAARVGLSESHLRNRFREATGVSLGRFIMTDRFRRAELLLAREDVRIGEIAETCGFSSLYAFSRAFSNHAGESPTDFRRRSREGVAAPKSKKSRRA